MEKINKPIIMDDEDAYLAQIAELKRIVNRLEKENKPTKKKKKSNKKAK